MEKEMLEKWKKIYSFAQLIAAYEPWELFEEENTFALVPKGTRNEHFFPFWQNPPDNAALRFIRTVMLM